MTRLSWTNADDQVLRDRYPHERAACVARVLGRSLRSVYARAAQLGLQKSAEFQASAASGRVLPGQSRAGAVATQFKPGQKSWNKGVRGSAGHHPNSRRTQFKKGCMTGAAQHNHQPIGTLRINNGVLEQKVTDDPALYPARRWRPVSRIVWERANGQIPEGHAVVFKAGCATTDPERITPEILELLSRQELMRRNSRHTRYPPEVNRAIQLLGAVKRKINNRTKDQANDQESNQ